MGRVIIIPVPYSDGDCVVAPMIYYVLPETENRGSVWYPRSTVFENAATFECVKDSLWEVASADRRRVLRIDAPLTIALRTFLRQLFPGEQVILREVPAEEVETFRQLHIDPVNAG